MKLREESISQREPLMSRNIDRLIDYIASKGIEVSIITNELLFGMIHLLKDTKIR
jgi:MoaA/NifB/PqqE/SkfB family radical SAM enzyme